MRVHTGYKQGTLNLLKTTWKSHSWLVILYVNKGTTAVFIMGNFQSLWLSFSFTLHVLHHENKTQNQIFNFQ